MTQFANIVVRLLEDLRRMTGPEDKREPAPPAPVPEDNRPPKRPWEDMSRGDAAHPEVRGETLIRRRSVSLKPDSSSMRTTLRSRRQSRTWKLYGASVQRAPARRRRGSPRASTANEVYVRLVALRMVSRVNLRFCQAESHAPREVPFVQHPGDPRVAAGPRRRAHALQRLWPA